MSAEDRQRTEESVNNHAAGDETAVSKAPSERPLRARARGTATPFVSPDDEDAAKLAMSVGAMARGSMAQIEAPGEGFDNLDSADLEDDDDFEDDDCADEGEMVADGNGGEIPAVSRKIRRRRRRERPRSKTIAMKRLTREELRIGALMFPPVDEARPTHRVQCASGEQRPCPWVACKHHLYLDINPETGSIKINFPDLEPWEMKQTCALDVAERGGITLEEVGEIMNLTRERIRQVEVRGLLKLKMGSPSPDELGADLLREKAERERN